ncbi:MAG: hypothetical protein U0V87_10815 [Acidobacteriota bacterium]
MSEVTEVGEQVDWAGWPEAGVLLAEIARGNVERRGGLAEMVAALEANGRGAMCRPQPSALEDNVEFAKVEHRHVDAVGKLVLDRPQSAMAYAADVERAVHGMDSVMAVRSRPK